MPAGSEQQPIVIAGAGIGGLTAALALAAAGFRVELAERTEALSEVGAGVQIGPNAGRVLAGLGLDAAMAEAAIEPQAIDILNGITGRRLTTIAGSAFRQRYGFPYRVIHRADLQSLLAAAVARTPAIRLHLGTIVEGAQRQANGLLVSLKRGEDSDTLPASTLIAAEGVWSAHRQTILDGAIPKPTGRTAWRALAPAGLVTGLADMRRVCLWLGPNAHLVQYPVARGTAVNLVAVVEEIWHRPGWSGNGEPAEIAERFAGWCDVVRRLVATPTAWRKHALATVDPAGPWVDERTALLGDAAHAMVPFLAQGAAMAIEDAAVLAASLNGTADVPSALRAYEAARKPRVKRLWQAALSTGETYHFGTAMGTLRNAALAVAGTRLVLGQAGWIYQWVPPEIGGPATRAERLGR